MVGHELSKYSRSNLTSVVCDNLCRIPYQEIWLLREEMTSLAVRLSCLHMSATLRNSQPWWWLWWLVSSKRYALTFTQGRSGNSIGTSGSFRFALECSSHTRQAATISSLCADIPGQSRTRPALLLHLTIPSWVSWIFFSISDWSLLGTMSLSTLSSESLRQVSTSR